MSISKKITAALAFTALTFSGAAHAASVTASASATIATPIAISQTTAMNFGTVVASAATGTAVLATNSALTVTGGVQALGGTPAAAAFSVTGQSGATFAITLPTTATLTSGANTMSLGTFAHSAGATPTLTGGSSAFNVGATLSVGANQAAGAYSGTYAVTVNYN